MQVQQATSFQPRRPNRPIRTMDAKDRSAPTQLPPAPETPSEVAASVLSTLPPAGGGEPPSVLEPEGRDFEKTSIKEMAAQELLDGMHWLKARQKELVDPEGFFAQSRIQTVHDIAIVVDRGFDRIQKAFEPRFQGIEQKLSKQGEMIFKLEKAYEELKRETATKLLDLEQQIKALKEHRGAAGEAEPAPAS